MPTTDELTALGSQLMEKGLYLQLFCRQERDGKVWRCIFNDEGTDVIIVYEKHANLEMAIKQALQTLATMPEDKNNRTLHAIEHRQRQDEEPSPLHLDGME